MRLGSQLVLIAVLPAAVAIVVGALAWNTSVERETAVQRERAVRRINTRVVQLDHLLYDSITHRSERAREQWFAKHAAVGELLASIHFTDPSDRALLDSARDTHRQMVALFERLTEPELHAKLSPELEARLTGQMRTANETLVSLVSRLAASNENERDKVVRRSGDLMVGTVTGMALFLAGLSIALSRGITQRQKAQEALSERGRELAESEERFRNLVEQSPNALLMVDRTGAIRLVNAEAERLFGYSRDELFGQGVEMLIPKRSRPNHEIWRKSYQEHPEARPMGAGRDLYALCKCGTEVPVEIALTPIEMKEGTAVLATITNITERKKAEEGMRESEERLSAAIRVAGLGILEHDHLADVIHYSERMRDIVGFAPDEKVDIPAVLQRVHPEDRERISAAIQKAHDPKGNGTFDVEHRLLRPDGSTRWVSIKSQTIFAPHNGEMKPLRTVGAAIDVTELKRAEESLRRREQELDLAIRGADMGTWNWDLREGGTLLWSSRCKTLFGLDPDEPVTQERYLQSVHPDDRKMVTGATQHALDSHSDLNLEHRVVWPDGTTHWIANMGRGFYSDETEEPLWMGGVALDITERRRVQEQIKNLNAELEQRVRQRTAALKEANAELEGFTYTVSHDLRAPLRHMTGFAQMLQTSSASSLDEQGQRYLRIVVESADRMGRLMDQLLAFSRLGRAALNKRDVELNTLIQGVVEELLHSTEGRKIRWKISSLPQVKADPELLRLVFINLVSNAIKFTRNKEVGIIEVGAREEAQEWIIFVKDNGAGFESEYAHKLFGVFQRLHRQEEFEGSGIGLANVRRIVSRHGGRTWAEGEVNKGAIFYFTLPKSGYSNREAGSHGAETHIDR